MIWTYLKAGLREAWRRRWLTAGLVGSLVAAALYGLLTLPGIDGTAFGLLRDIRLREALFLFPLGLFCGLLYGVLLNDGGTERWRRFGPTRSHGPALYLSARLLTSALAALLVTALVALVSGGVLWLAGGNLFSIYLGGLPLLLPGILFAAALGGLLRLLVGRWALVLGLLVLAAAFYGPLLWSKLQFGLPALRPLFADFAARALFQRPLTALLAGVQLLLYAVLCYTLALFRLVGVWFDAGAED